MALVEPAERTAAAGYTNTARYIVRPLGPVLAGAGQSVFIGLPFVVAGTTKAIYDLVPWRWFRGVTLPEEAIEEPAPPQPQALASIAGPDQYPPPSNENET